MKKIKILPLGWVAILCFFCSASIAEIAQQEEMVLERSNLKISSFPLAKKNTGTELFTQIQADKIGLVRTNHFNVEDLWPPFYYGRGVASGDIHNDGWVDVVFATEKGLQLYRNKSGASFEAQPITAAGLPDLNIFMVALVDINNDGWLDLFICSYRDGNYYLLNHQGNFDNELIKAPVEVPILTLGLSFGDLDKDGDLDAAIGNWYYGWPKQVPPEDSANSLLFWDDNQYKRSSLSGMTGETLSMLITDYNGDDNTDLIVGNDFVQPDIFYLGDGSGSLKEIERRDGKIDITTTFTMSIDTADIDNDLDLEIYIAQIAAGISEDVAQIERQRLKYYCDIVTTEKQRKDCQKNIDIRWFFRFGSKHNPLDVKKCLEIKELDERELCMSMTIMKTAVQLKQPQLCEKIPSTSVRASRRCHDFFKPGISWTKAAHQNAIPQHQNQNVLLIKDKAGVFQDQAEGYGVEIGDWSWNTKFADLDNDGWQDLYLVNGSIRRGAIAGNLFFRNEGGKRFSDHTKISGLQNFMAMSSYTYFDVDNDGDLDIVATSINGPAWFYRNNATDHSVIFEIRDFNGNHFGIGSKIIIHYGKDSQLHQMREIKAGGGYISFDAPFAHFGLGEYESISKVEVIWSTGEKEIIEASFGANKKYIIYRNGER